MRPTTYALAALGGLLLSSVPALAGGASHGTGGGWLCTAHYPKSCYYEGANPNVAPIPNYEVTVYRGGNGTGYQDFAWQQGDHAPETAGRKPHRHDKQGYGW